MESAANMNREDTLDLGQRYFVCSVFSALTIGVLLTLLLIGAAFSWLGLLVCVAANLSLVIVAERLYSKGMIGLARINLLAQTVVCLLFVGLALSTQNKLENWLIAGVLGASAAFYASMFLSSHIGVFVANKRGEKIDLASADSLIGATPTEVFVARDTKVGYSDPLKQTFKLLSLVAFAAGALLFLVSGAAIVGGIVGLFVLDLGDWFGLLLIGALAHVLAMVLFTTSSDSSFLAKTQGFEANHLNNTMTSLKMFLNLQIGMAALMVVVLLVRWVATS